MKLYITVTIVCVLNFLLCLDGCISRIDKPVELLKTTSASVPEKGNDGQTQEMEAELIFPQIEYLSQGVISELIVSIIPQLGEENLFVSNKEVNVDFYEEHPRQKQICHYKIIFHNDDVIWCKGIVEKDDSWTTVANMITEYWFDEVHYMREGENWISEQKAFSTLPYVNYEDYLFELVRFLSDTRTIQTKSSAYRYATSDGYIYVLSFSGCQRISSVQFYLVNNSTLEHLAVYFPNNVSFIFCEGGELIYKKYCDSMDKDTSNATPLNRPATRITRWGW